MFKKLETTALKCPPKKSHLRYVRPLQAVCRSLWSGSGCERASDQGGPAGVPGRDEGPLPQHAERAVGRHERTGAATAKPTAEPPRR